MIKLNNGAVVHRAELYLGGSGLRPFLGTVLACWEGHVHPWVTWVVASDDGVTWDAGTGHYFHSKQDALEDYQERKRS